MDRLTESHSEVRVVHPPFVGCLDAFPSLPHDRRHHRPPIPDDVDQPRSGEQLAHRWETPLVLWCRVVRVLVAPKTLPEREPAVEAPDQIRVSLREQLDERRPL